MDIQVFFLTALVVPTVFLATSSRISLVFLQRSLVFLPLSDLQERWICLPPQNVLLCHLLVRTGSERECGLALEALPVSLSNLPPAYLCRSPPPDTFYNLLDWIFISVQLVCSSQSNFLFCHPEKSRCTAILDAVETLHWPWPIHAPHRNPVAAHQHHSFLLVRNVLRRPWWQMNL